MPNLDQSFLEDLLSRIDIIEVIGDRVTLKKSGNDYKGLCPFHNEKTPSFIVSNLKQYYHCFGCGAHGNAINFLKEHDGLHFIEAVEKLAQLANIELPKNKNTQFDNYKNLLEVNNIAKELFKKNLEAHAEAKKYLSTRGIENNQINLFEIGFAKDSWDNLKNTLKNKKIENNALEVGLLNKKNQRVFDIFKNRIMFPIKNSLGNTIAFGGRTLSKSDQAKYINSPESKLFNKSYEMYGLFESKKYINKLGYVIVVEGYTDVIALHKNKFENSVATLGTAFTKHHLKKLHRYTKNIIFCFDGDIAGKNAAWKALVNCLTEIRDDSNIKFCFLPDGHDPDDISNKKNSEFKDFLKSSQPLSEFIFNHQKTNLDLSISEDKSKYISSILPLINQIPNGFYKTILEEKLMKITNLSRNDIFEAKVIKKSADKKINRVEIQKNYETLIIPLILEYPDLIDKYKEKIKKLFNNDLILKIVDVFILLKKNNTNINAAMLIECFSDNKNILENFLTTNILEKDKKSAEDTISSIINNVEKKQKEEEYFIILEKHSKGIKLSDSEKIKLKNFKK